MTTETFDMTPTWAALLPAMLAVLDNPDESFDVMNAKMNIRHELSRMARAADLWNKHTKAKDAADARD